ncbi:Nicotinate-nucleotide adenylyltransferase [Candidatus Rhodobacter oscarellae]|uniref:Probable nicotinate-nucleotide adenylyltransferase n=1 Tax=Candidatus Rhodobacter oscarellae TaxID=1675527 RepID=A0A0J9E8P0_9RHOB|nr:nicotinate-nucleotide adenylyltransferase [Candidatus Rhodobacter lobularis]KMW59036.1 Nicotinate-nucleotide adenylyltransferase [Candidatus Rhodobacter lobularis]
MGKSAGYFDRSGLPVARAGQTVGLLGGSFDPPHAGHVHISRHALRRFGLDALWWLVSPGNPLKTEGPAPLDRRMSACRAIMDHPKVIISDAESRLGTRYTAETLRALRRRYCGVNFVWIMGADNLASFHHWEQWRWIMENVPIAVLARPGDRTEARHSRAATQYRRAQLSGKDAKYLTKSRAPCWCFVNVPMVNLSSTQIRARGDWKR